MQEIHTIGADRHRSRRICAEACPEIPARSGHGSQAVFFLTHALCLESLATLRDDRFVFTSPERREVSSVAACQRGNGCGST
jgi:hypothetical protein